MTLSLHSHFGCQYCFVSTFEVNVSPAASIISAHELQSIGSLGHAPFSAAWIQLPESVLPSTCLLMKMRSPTWIFAGHLGGTLRTYPSTLAGSPGWYSRSALFSSSSSKR